MERFTEDQIEQAIQYLQDVSEKESRKIMRKLQKKQEPLLVYVAALIEREELNEDEQDLLTSLVLVLWKLTSEAYPGQRMIMIDQVDALDTRIRKELESALEFSEKQLLAAAEEHVTRLKSLSHPELVDLLLTEIMEAPEDSGIREEMKGILFTYSAGILEALLQASVPSAPTIVYKSQT